MTRIVVLKRSLGIAAIAAALAAGSFALGARAEEAPRVIPAPVLDEPAGQRGAETIVLAGGCFWGVQGVFQHVKGVTRAVSGYAGGEAATAHYEITGRGDTGHAESVQVTFDPAEISLGRILQIYFSVAHDPTQLNRQGPDSGTQYRSAIFPASDEQAKIARAYMAQLNQARVYQAAIVTKIEPGRTFYPAEAYHQDFLARNPTYPYIRINDLPKIAALKQLYPGVYREAPVLVGDAMR
ncbi:peptide-methionine (S)-S-oxide reductase MsrA [Rhodoblastus sp. 17X3]|uniref:peptide-methionine (S)-S-oxide reductase MsrA n=1 Tax=Rhodoblastus sp. 17X3 TaxID=3047026 RepID=UPI0024B70139|nr:peptide-methionine (S)-S-oxide reductase MsrA [Rhodoblastus sp. 17X3]MDI9849258.1 peptide-methionine (S)-S-oxide reductase MsrA [Rhodoblastus sp. 17X3]